jgi:hypothetical protein
MEMNRTQDIEELKIKIMAQIADLSKLLGMMDNEDTVVLDARNSFLKLSTLISRALDIPLQ